MAANVVLFSLNKILQLKQMFFFLGVVGNILVRLGVFNTQKRRGDHGLNCACVYFTDAI